MQTPQPANTKTSAIASTRELELARRQIERDGGTVELGCDELEERVTPRLASNHNETILTA